MDNNFVAHLFNNLEIVTASVGGIGVLLFISSTKIKKSEDDVSQYIVEIKKHKESLNKRSKSTL